MSTLKKVIAAGMIAALGTTALVPLAQAGESKATDVTATHETTTKTAATKDVVTATDITVSGTGRNVMTGIQYAKAAIDQGQTDVAKQILTELSGMFSDQDGSVIMKADGAYALPLDTGLTVAEGFTPSDAHQVAFTEAETLMQNGNIEQAISTLTKAGVDLVAQVALLPYSPTVDGLNQAKADLDAGHIDKAASALDGINKSVHVATFAPDAVPAQGYAMTDVIAG